MTTLQLIEAVALSAAGLALMARAHLLGGARGWPSACWPVRTSLGLLGLTALGRAIQIVLRDAETTPSEVLLAVALAVCAVVLAVNLITQRVPREIVLGISKRLHLSPEPDRSPHWPGL